MRGAHVGSKSREGDAHRDQHGTDAVAHNQEQTRDLVPVHPVPVRGHDSLLHVTVRHEGRKDAHRKPGTTSVASRIALGRFFGLPFLDIIHFLRHFGDLCSWNQGLFVVLHVLLVVHEPLHDKVVG